MNSHSETHLQASQPDHSEDVLDMVPIQSQEGGAIYTKQMSPDVARTCLLEIQEDYFTDKSFADYILNKLAGDFACQIVNAFAAALSTPPNPSSESVMQGDVRPHEPAAYWAETGTVGNSLDSGKPFWRREEAIAHINQHGGWVVPLYPDYAFAPGRERIPAAVWELAALSTPPAAAPDQGLREAVQKRLAAVPKHKPRADYAETYAPFTAGIMLGRWEVAHEIRKALASHPAATGGK